MNDYYQKMEDDSNEMPGNEGLLSVRSPNATVIPFRYFFSIKFFKFKITFYVFVNQ